MFPRRHFIVMLVLLVLPAVVQAQFTFTTNNGSITITGYTGPGGVVIIPAMTNGYAVTDIGTGVFGGNEVTSVVIPNGINDIEREAFQNAEDLTNIVIPNSVTNIGFQAFRNCKSLTSVTIPGSDTSIGMDAFAFCTSMTNSIISGGIIGQEAFYGCTNLTSATIGANVTSIGEGAFYVCTSLTNISVDAANPFYSSLNGVLFDEAQDTLIDYPQGLKGPYTIPNSVTNIGQEAFYDCTNLTGVTISNSVTSIEDYAFESCINLTGVTIPGSVTSIGEYAFSGCSSLTNVIITYGVTSIGDYAFESCANLASVTIPGSVASIGDYAFYSCGSLTSATISNGVASIGTYAFYDSGLTSVTIPNSVTNISYAFYECSNLTSVTIASGMSYIGDYAFYGCGLTSITIPASVTGIGELAFYGCHSLANVTIINGATNIGFASFYLCTNLTSITIPASVTSIEQEAFYACYNLTNISVDAVNPSYSSLNGVLFDKAQNTLVDYPPALTNTTYTVPASVSSLGEYAFAFCTNLTSAYFQGNAPSVVGGTFYDVHTTAYYLPGTTGWGAMLDDARTALWFLPRPTVLSFEPSFGLQNGQFGFLVSWATNVSVVVQACTNLANPTWIPMATNSLSSGTNYFSDAQWANYPSRFYRVSGP